MRIVGQNPHRLAVEACQARDLAPPETLGQLEERPLVDHQFEDAPHLVGLAALLRNDGEQLFFLTVAIVRGRDDRGVLVDVRRHVAQEASHQGGCLFLVLSDAVHHTRRLVDPVTTELFLGERLAQRPLHQGGTADLVLCRFLDHDREV